MLDPVLAARLASPESYQPKEWSGLNQGSLLREYVSCLELLDHLGYMVAALEKIRNSIREDFVRRSEAESVDKFSGEGITITVKDENVVQYDPQKWDAILKQLVDNGHGYAVYRQLSAPKVQSLMDSGVRLPDGLTLTTIKKVSHRRNTRSS